MNTNDKPDPDNSRPSAVLALVPNLLSIGRLAVGLVFPWIDPRWRVVAVLAGAASDGLDGIISRKLHATTTTGRILDPIADKAFVISVLVTLLLDDSLKLWQVALVGSRDLAVLAGSGFVVVTEGWSAIKRMPPSWLGKITTAAQFVFLLTALYYRELILAVFIPTVALSVAAGADYLRRYWTRRVG